MSQYKEFFAGCGYMGMLDFLDDSRPAEIVWDGDITPIQQKRIEAKRRRG